MARFLVLVLIVMPLKASEDLRLAVEAFQQSRFTESAAHYEKASRAKPLSADQQAAWVYCRVRIAAEKWNASKGDAAIAKHIVAEISDALALVPDYAELQKFGNRVIVAAGGTPPVIVKPIAHAPTPADTGWFSLEDENFRVRFPAVAKELAEAISKSAEEQRTQIFTRWSGPPSGAWTPKCEIVIHATAAEFAAATNQKPSATGHALVQLNGGKPVSRRIDLRADDASAAIDALPRELTHIVLSDLFPHTAPPRWAADGMAILAMSPDMIGRYLKTAVSQSDKLPSASDLLQSEKHDSGVASAALVDFLVKQKSERSLTVFLRDSQRYGLEKSLERQFGMTFKSLNATWLTLLPR